MKKLLGIISVMMLISLNVFAQTTAAPDQPTIGVNTNDQTNITIGLGNPTGDNNAAAAEKEITKTEGVVYNDGKIDYASSDAKFVINAKDEGSGVKAIWVSVDNSDFGIYGNALGFVTEGEHGITYRVVDNVGNTASLKSYQFVLDKTGPEVNLVSDKKPILIADVVYIGSNYNFSINAIDNLSGIKSVEYAVDDGQMANYEKNIAASGTNGFHKVSYKAVDNVGNASETKIYTYFLDTTAPIVSIDFATSAYDKDGVKYISELNQVIVKSKDNETGISQIMVAVDGDDWVNYQSPIRLKNGAHTIKAKAIDLVGNTGDEISSTINVDGIVPTGDIVPTK